MRFEYYPNNVLTSGFWLIALMVSSCLCLIYFTAQGRNVDFLGFFISLILFVGSSVVFVLDWVSENE